jgi:hypothetical protein
MKNLKWRGWCVPVTKLYRVIPPGYGIGYMKVDTHTCYCYPIPLNLLVQLARRLWVFGIQGWGFSAKVVALFRAYRRGLVVGKEVEQRLQKLEHPPAVKPRPGSEWIPVETGRTP